MESRQILRIGDQSLFVLPTEFAAQVRPDELRFIGVLIGLLDGSLGNVWRNAPAPQLPQYSLGPEGLILAAKARVRFGKIRVVKVPHLGQSPDDLLDVFRPSRPAAQTRAELGNRQRAPPERSNRVFIEGFSSQQAGSSRGHRVILACGATSRRNVKAGRNEGHNLELIPDLENGGFATRVPDIPACGEGDTEAAVADLKEALGVHIEELGLEESLSPITATAELRRLDVS